MQTPWQRIDTELGRRGRNWQWLADEMGTSIQRVHNWKTRGVPTDAWLDVATALHITIDYIAGLSDDPQPHTARSSSSYGWPFGRVTLERVARLPQAARERVEAFIEATVLAWEAERDRKKRAG